MSKARDLANLISTGSPLADGAIAASEVSGLATVATSGAVADVTGAAPLASPTFTGTPSAPTPATSANTTQIATTAFVKADIANLVDSSPDALNTLNELAAALGDDANFSTTVTNNIATKAPISNPTFTGTATATAFVGDGSGLTGIQGNSFDATADGAIANGDPVILQANGTVKKVIQTANQQHPARSGMYSFHSTAEKNMCLYDPTSESVHIITRPSNNVARLINITLNSSNNVVEGTNYTISSKITTGPAVGQGLAVYDTTYDKIVYLERNSSNARIDYHLINWNGSAYSTVDTSTVTTENAFYPAVAIDQSSGKVLATYVKPAQNYVACKVGTLSSTGISWGSETLLSNYASEYTHVSYNIQESKFVVVWNKQSPRTLEACTVSISGTTATAGTAVTISTSNPYEPQVHYDPINQKTVILWRHLNSDGRAANVSISGSNITVVGTLGYGTAHYTAVSYDTILNKFLFTWRDAADNNYWTASMVDCSGSTPVLDYETRLQADNMKQLMSAYYASKNLHLAGGQNGSAGNQGEIGKITTSTASSNLTANNYLGIADAAYADGATATIQTMGAIDDAQSGLTVGSKHFVQSDGTLATSAGSPSVEAGLALSATKLLVKG